VLRPGWHVAGVCCGTVATREDFLLKQLQSKDTLLAPTQKTSINSIIIGYSLFVVVWSIYESRTIVVWISLSQSHATRDKMASLRSTRSNSSSPMVAMVDIEREGLLTPQRRRPVDTILLNDNQQQFHQHSVFDNTAMNDDTATTTSTDFRKIQKQEQKQQQQQQQSSEPLQESHMRSILKGLTWRIVASLTTITIAWWVTGQVAVAFQIGLVEFVAKIGIYYVHERLWLQIPI
jgi:uncharacterized membrane protein